MEKPFKVKLMNGKEEWYEEWVPVGVTDRSQFGYYDPEDCLKSIDVDTAERWSKRGGTARIIIDTDKIKVYGQETL